LRLGTTPSDAKEDCLSARDFSRILLIKPSALGDVVHTIPVLAKLRARYPRARIDWLLTPENADLMRHHPALSAAVVFDRRKLETFGRRMDGTRGMLQLLARLYRSRYDLVIDLHGQLRSAFFTLVTGASVRVGFDKPIPFARTVSAHFELKNRPERGWRGAREGSWIAYTHRIPIPTLDVHAIDRYLWVGKLLGFEESFPETEIFLSSETKAKVQGLLAGYDFEKFVVLVPGTIWETKHWPAERFAEVGRTLKKDRGLGIVVAGTAQEKARCSKVAELCPSAVDLSGKTTPADLAALISRAEICVTNDSGSMHLAVALRRPVVSLFGPTNPVHIGPYGHPESVIRVDHLACSPCNYRKLSQCPHKHTCMQQLTASMVIARIERLLEEHKE
jgi:lipopolysaccharide heptosyltransferase I